MTAPLAQGSLWAAADRFTRLRVTREAEGYALPFGEGFKVVSLRTSDRCHWCGNPLLFGGFPRQCAHWLGMTLLTRDASFVILSGAQRSRRIRNTQKKRTDSSTSRPMAASLRMTHRGKFLPRLAWHRMHIFSTKSDAMAGKIHRFSGLFFPV